MIRFRAVGMYTLCFLAAGAATARAHTLLKKPFQEKYKYKSVTCYACHDNGRDEQGKRLGKEFLNDLGKTMKKALGGGRVSRRMEQAKKTPKAGRKEIHDEVVKQFLEVLTKIEQMKAPSGESTWGALLKAGEIEGVKMAVKK